MNESFCNLNYICLFILGVQNLCCKAFESIFTKDLVFDLDVKHVFHGIEFLQILNLQVDKVGWTNQTIPVFLLSSLTWILYWKVSLYSGWCHIWRYCCQRLKHFVDWCACFLSNSGNLKSCIVTTFCVLRWPVRVLTSLVSPSNLVVTPLGKADL